MVRLYVPVGTIQYRITYNSNTKEKASSHADMQGCSRLHGLPSTYNMLYEPMDISQIMQNPKKYSHFQPSP